MGFVVAAFDSGFLDVRFVRSTCVLRGHYSYFRMPHDWRSLNGFSFRSKRPTYLVQLPPEKQEDRRMGWDWFEAVTTRLPLPPPPITHPWTPGAARCE